MSSVRLAPDAPPTTGLEQIWPLFAIRIRTTRLELRPPDDNAIAALAAVAHRGVHDPHLQPFGNGWTDRPPQTFGRGFAQYFWAQRAGWTASSWALPFAVYHDGVPVGVQQVKADAFPVLRTIGTGSWLSSALHGRGIGTEMRAAALEFGFAGLGANEAVSGAYDFNPGSIRVSEKLGYVRNGVRRDEVRGRPETAVLFRLSRASWEASDRPTVEIDGLEDCLDLFGIDDAAAR